MNGLTGIFGVIAGILSFFSIFNQLKIFNDLKAKVKQGMVKPQPDKA